MYNRHEDCTINDRNGAAFETMKIFLIIPFYDVNLELLPPNLGYYAIIIYPCMIMYMMINSMLFER